MSNYNFNRFKPDISRPNSSLLGLVGDQWVTHHSSTRRLKVVAWRSMALHVQLMALGIIAAQLLELRVDGGPPYFSHGEAVGNNATAKCWQKNTCHSWPRIISWSCCTWYPMKILWVGQLSKDLRAKCVPTTFRIIPGIVRVTCLSLRLSSFKRRKDGRHTIYFPENPDIYWYLDTFGG